MQVMASGLEGQQLEKFVIFNNGGRNGKGLLDDLFLQALGHYGMVGNEAVLFEKSKTGGNPEIAKMHKKRYIVFREPPDKQKIENAIVRKLTGGGTLGV
jgi:phage/plasmid-associated DNA primase